MDVKIWKDPDNGKRRHRNRMILSPNGDKNCDKAFIDSFSNLDVILWVKEICLDPCKMGASTEYDKNSYDQVLNLQAHRRTTNLESPQRERKHKEFPTSKVTSTSRSARNTCNQQIGRKFSEGHLSDKSFHHKKFRNWSSSINLLTNENTNLWKQTNVNESGIDVSSPLFNLDVPILGSTRLTLKNLPCHQPFLEVDDLSQSCQSLDSACLTELELDYSRFPRLAIPVGPRFQADVPNWNNQSNKEKIKQYKGNIGTTRCIGTHVWPMENATKHFLPKRIGKGRPNSCSCKYPTSPDCLKRHMLDKRLDLQEETGPAFWTWKFDEMGEFISNLWALKEEKEFYNLKLKYFKDDIKFWEEALKCLPQKSKKGILSYYFNVFVPKRLTVKIRLSSKQVYSDDDEDVEEMDEYEEKDSRAKRKSRRNVLRDSNDVKRRYLCRVR